MWRRGLLRETRSPRLCLVTLHRELPEFHHGFRDTTPRFPVEPLSRSDIKSRGMRQLDNRHDRRTLLRGIGVTLLGVGLAGCTGPGGGDEEDDEGGEEDDEGGGDDEEDEGGGYGGEGGERLRQPDAR